MTTGESRWDYPDIETPAPPPPPPPDVVNEDDHNEQPVSCSSGNKPVTTDTDTSVSLPSTEVSTTTADTHKVPDTSCITEDIFEGPQLPDSMAMLTEDVLESRDCNTHNTLDVPVHPGEPPPPGFDPPEDLADQLASSRYPEIDSSATMLDASASIDGMPYSPDSSDDVKDNDFDVDKMLENTALSMATESYQKNVVSSMATESYHKNTAIPMVTESFQKSTAVPMVPDGSQQASAVIYQPPKTKVTALSSAVTTIQPPVSYQPPLPVDQPAVASFSPVNSPAPPDDEPSSSMQDDVERRERKEKKKKKEKEKKISSTSLTYKKKNVSSLVQKWHQVKVQVEQEEKLNEERQMAIRQKLEEWKQTHS